MIRYMMKRTMSMVKINVDHKNRFRFTHTQSPAVLNSGQLRLIGKRSKTPAPSCVRQQTHTQKMDIRTTIQ